MTALDIAEFTGLLVSAWTIGFAAGFTLTKFKDALNQTV